MCYSRRDGIDSSYKMCQFSLVDGNAVREHTMLIVFPGFSVVSDKYQRTFEPGEHVSVRFCKMDRQSYDFWKGYMDEWIFSRNPFFPVSANPQRLRNLGRIRIDLLRNRHPRIVFGWVDAISRVNTVLHG